MELDWLKDFAALADVKSFSRAAEARNVTQPAFSRRIRALEDWVGAKLFTRGAQGASLTAAGAHFLPAAADLLRLLERARRETQAVGTEQTSPLSIAATHALSFTFFPRWIRDVSPTSALGPLSLVSDSMTACEDIILAGEAHFLLGHFHSGLPSRLDSRFESVRVGEDVLAPFCAPNPDGTPSWTLQASTTVQLLAYSAVSGLGRILSASGILNSLEVKAVFTSHLAATLASMAADGHGIAWLPQTMVHDDVTRGRLVRAGGAPFEAKVEIRLVRSPECRNAAANKLWARVCEPHGAERDLLTS